MANKRRIKPLTLRESIFEQEYRLKQQAKETLKKIKNKEIVINYGIQSTR